MALKKVRAELRNYFLTGLRPSQSDFADLIESSLNILEDKATDAEALISTNNDKFINNV